MPIRPDVCAGPKRRFRLCSKRTTNSYFAFSACDTAQEIDAQTGDIRYQNIDGVYDGNDARFFWIEFGIKDDVIEITMPENVIRIGRSPEDGTFELLYNAVMPDGIVSGGLFMSPISQGHYGLISSEGGHRFEEMSYAIIPISEAGQVGSPQVIVHLLNSYTISFAKRRVCTAGLY